MDAFHAIAKPRPDVEQGVINEHVYAASLSDLLHHSNSDTGRRYWDSEEFDKLTYMTDGLRKALDDVRLRLQEGQGNGFRQIETAFGGGKTHAMIAMYHRCREWGTDAVVIDGQELDASKQTVWGEIERQLNGSIKDMDGLTSPGGSQIYDLLHDRKKPVLILLDEISHYLDSALDVKLKDRPNVATQTVNFMQRLFTKVGQMPNVCVVISLPDREKAQSKEHYDHLRSVAGRQRQLITVATESDRPHIIRRRLFETDEQVIEDRAGENIKAYVARCVEGKSITPDDANDYIDEFTGTYPFTPDVLEVLFDRWATYHSFQRTRGALRLLSVIVNSLLKSKRTEITLADVNLEVPVIREELVKHAGENLKGIINADITGRHAGAKEHKEVGVRCARTIFMYSFPRECKGATQAEIKRAVSTDKITHSEVGDVLWGFQKRLFHLDLTNDDMYRFMTQYNINRVIQRAKDNVNPREIEVEEGERLKAAADGGGFGRVVVWPDRQERIEDKPTIQLVILRENDPEQCRWLVSNVGPKQGRANSNALAFVMPTNGGKLAENLRVLLAMKRIRQTQSDVLESNPINNNRVKAEESDAEAYIPRGLREKYAEVWLPNKDGGTKRLDVMMMDPLNDRLSIGKIVWDYLVKVSEVHESFTRYMLDAEYGGDPDVAFRKMMTTPGERRPASLEVLRNAEESKKEPEPQPTITGGRFVGGGDEPGGLGEPDVEPKKPTAAIPGLRCSCVIERDKLAGLGSVLATVRPLSTTKLRFSVNQRADDKLDVILDIDGEIGADDADDLRGFFPDNASWKPLKDWDE